MRGERGADTIPGAYTRCASKRRPCWWPRETAISFALPNCLHIDCDRHRVTNNQSPFVHGVVPTHAEVVTIDLRRRYKARSRPRSPVDPLSVLLFPPGCLPLTKIAHSESDRPGDAAD